MTANKLLNVADYSCAAREALASDVFDYYDGGAFDEITLGENVAAWQRLKLYYRVMAGVAEVDLTTTVLGAAVSMPILVAPTAFHKLACADGEISAARAVARARTAFCLSSLSTTAMENVFAEAASPKWFQLYIYKDRGVTRELVARAEAAGAEAIVLTVDAPGWGNRERDARNGFRLPPGLAVANVAPVGKGELPQVKGSGLASYVREHFESALSFDDLDWLCALTDLPVVVKGVCRGDDARRSAEQGARAVVVSNHGGRQLDTAPATCDALPHVVERVGGACEVYVDGGIRRGSDVLKALALGARAVLVGRPLLWGLAVDGEDGAVRVLELLRSELQEAMLLCGYRSVGQIDGTILAP
ncbi:MAG TPA: alpha-hydroxy acid oxidase [Actinomycetota bacterium]|nr:alpha-hydroxy acid oxidase [Actinomycetota bacterium]